MIHLKSFSSILMLFCFLGTLKDSNIGILTNKKMGANKNISLAISLDSGEMKNWESPLEVTATFHNHGKRPFRILDGIFFSQPNQEYGEISFEIFREGELYDDWKQYKVKVHYKSPDRFEVAEILPDEQFVVKGDIALFYFLTKAGNYRMRAIFRPARVKGKKLSIIKPVYSNWIEVKVLEGLDK